MIWSLFGAIVGWIQGVIGQFRSTSGYLEHTSNGSTWYPVSIPLVKASANVKYTWATERFTSSGAVENMKVAQITPNFSGIIRVRAETKYVGTAGTILLLNPKASGSGTYDGSIAGSGSYDSTAFTTLPLGTILSSGLSYARASLFGIPSTSYTAQVADISVTAGIPVIIGLYDGSTASGQSYIKNITFSYDIVTGTEQMV